MENLNKKVSVSFKKTGWEIEMIATCGGRTYKYEHVTLPIAACAILCAKDYKVSLPIVNPQAIEINLIDKYVYQPENPGLSKLTLTEFLDMLDEYILNILREYPVTETAERVY